MSKESTLFHAGFQLVPAYPQLKNQPQVDQLETLVFGGKTWSVIVHMPTWFYLPKWVVGCKTGFQLITRYPEPLSCPNSPWSQKAGKRSDPFKPFRDPLTPPAIAPTLYLGNQLAHFGADSLTQTNSTSKHVDMFQLPRPFPST